MSNYKERFHMATPEQSDEVPDGKYPVKVIKSEIGPWSKRNQDLRWQLTLEITSGNFIGRRLWFKVGMTEGAAGFRRGALSALGVEWRNREVDLIEDVANRRAIAEVVYNADYDRSEVKRLRSGEQVAPGQTTTDDFRSDQVIGRENEEVPF